MYIYIYIYIYSPGPLLSQVTTDAATAFRKAFDGRVAVNTPITVRPAACLAAWLPGCLAAWPAGCLAARLPACVCPAT